MVLLEGIELSTSPLPRECSTTELQQPRLTASAFLASEGRGCKGLLEASPLDRAAGYGSYAAMTEDTQPPPPDRPRDDEKSRRAQRVAAALRENLRRRKEQARARAGDPAPAAPQGKP